VGGVGCEHVEFVNLDTTTIARAAHLWTKKWDILRRPAFSRLTNAFRRGFLMPYHVGRKKIARFCTELRPGKSPARNLDLISSATANSARCF
jgi:hypothetical protein